jgi:UDP-glucose 4-epimerase
MLRWYDQIHDLRWVAIRYFNAAGAALDGSLGEEHDPETHLIPNVIKAMQEGREFKLFGNDYNTPDGTCIRDYIHVEDLATAHIAALDGLAAGRHSDVYNAGTGKGYSNHEVIAMIEQVSGQKVNTIVASRRPGDPDELVADATKFQNEMGWKPVHSDLETIVKTAWAWHNR